MRTWTVPRRLAEFWLAVLALALARPGWSDTIQVTTTADSGAGSFRQALLTANANPGLDTIVFQISGTPPFTILPLSALPAITDPVVIDATTQPGFAGEPVIELNGVFTSAGTVGLSFSADGSTLRGMAINQFPAEALELDGASNVIQGNFMGTDVTGMVQLDNGACGLLIESAGNLIGGTNAGDGNVISAGATAHSAGIYILNAGGNVVQGNLIGVNAAGTEAFNSVNNGIILFGSGANVIGGPVAAARNVISGNGASGIYLYGPTAAGNLIQGNYIGTDLSGGSAIGNAGGDGVTLLSAPGNVICGNVISGNSMAGVSLLGASGNQVIGNFVGTDANGSTALANRYAGVSISGGGGNVIGGTNAGVGNVISGNGLDGVALTGGTGTNLIQGNLIGLTAAGDSSLPNGQNGITISGGTGNTIGGVVSGARNVISGNVGNGVDIVLVTDCVNVVQGNYIGTDATGGWAVANALAGVLIEGCSNLIGGTAAGAGNVISGNGQQGIWLVGNHGGATGNLIQGNYIGLTAAGTAGLGNGVSSAASAGIGISTASANLVGGVVAGAANVISANKGCGVFLVGSTALGNVLQGNLIGTDPTGSVGQGNAFAGVYLEEAATNQIGGSLPGAGNVISGNLVQGICLNNASWNVIQGNLIGTAADGTNNLGNQFHNVELQAGADNNVIGGTAPGAGNVLAFASMNYNRLYCGVRVRTGAVNDLISGNAIFNNGALGIDLSPTDGGAAAGVNPIVACESGVAANAANAGQNFPVLSNVYSGAITRVSGSLDSGSGRSYTLQFFASPVGNPSGYGEGRVFLGQTMVTLDGASCSSDFTVCLPASVPPGWVVTATATDPNNNTSGFSAWVPAIAGASVQLALTSSAPTNGYLAAESFLAVVQTNGVTAGNATGTVQWFTNGASCLTNDLAGGATAFSLSSLPRGANLITAVYSGDMDYLGGATTLVQTVTNHPPVAALMTVTRPPNGALNLALSDLATNWSDPDGDVVSLSSVNLVTTNGVSLVPINVATNSDGSYVITNTAFLGYVSSQNQNDQFSYAVSDGFGGTNIGFVNIVVAGGLTGANFITSYTFGSASNVIAALGIPGGSYILERSTDLCSWVEVSTNTASTNGLVNAPDYFYDLDGLAPSPGFYRLLWQP